MVDNDKSDFDAIADYPPQKIDYTIDANSDKPVPDRVKHQQPYFFSGHLVGSRRTKISTKSKGLIILDIEREKGDSTPLTDEDVIEEVHEVCQQYQYLLYPTINSRPNHARYRLIIEPERPMNEPESIAITEEFMNALSIPTDPSSKDFTRIHGLPVDNGLYEDCRIIVNRGEKVPVKEIKIDDNSLPLTLSKHEGGAYPIEVVEHYMTEYVNKFAEQLKERPYYVAVKMQIIKSFQNNVIDESGAIKAMEILAMGDEKWRQGNLKEFHAEKGNSNIRTEYDFTTIVQMVDGQTDYFILKEDELPKSMKEQYELLHDIGEIWRKERANKDGDSDKAPLMPYLKCARILKRYAKVILIGTEHDKARLAYFDYDKGHYVSSETMMNKLIKAVDYRYKPSDWKNVIEVLRTEVKLKQESDKPYLIPVANGIFNTNEQQLLPFSPKYIFTSKIKTAYNVDATNPCIGDFDFNEWLQSIACNDDEIVTLLWQVINEAINPNHTRNKIGFLIGDGNSGKGTFQTLLQNLIGTENIASLKPPQFADRFSKEMLVGKVCNIGDDISNAYLDEVSDLMSIATGDVVTIEPKGKPVYAVNLKLFCLFSGNSMPNVRNKSQGWHRRMLLIPFNADFNGLYNDPRIKNTFLNNKAILEYVLKTALELQFETFIVPKSVKAEIDKYKFENDFYRAFVEEVFIHENLTRFEKLPLSHIKDLLREYMDETGIRQKLPYHFVNPLIKALNDLTGEVYESKNARYASDYIQTIPSMLFPKVIAPQKQIRSLVRLTEPKDQSA
ncbi:phage/plasmid primase, P4 family [Falseniella ignava]|nr:phage/plasmid primase, P4 family [Falseniella ignava]